MGGAGDVCLTGRISNSDYQAIQHQGLWGGGRGNHYLFDINRDWLVQVHPETRGRMAAVLSWHPHLVVDSQWKDTHELRSNLVNERLKVSRVSSARNAVTSAPRSYNRVSLMAG